METPDVRISNDIFDKNGNFRAIVFVHDLMNQTPKLYFKTPINEKGGDVIWFFHEDKGIYQPDGICVAEAVAQRFIGEDVKRNHLNEIVKHLQVASYTIPADFQEDPATIVLKNGEYNIITGQLDKYNPYHNHRNCLPLTYNPDATCPEFLKFLSEVAEGDEATIQELFGYFLCRGYPIQKCFILQGSGANGKSTLLRVMEAFLGSENVSSLSLSDIVTKTFSRAELYNKLANIAPDIGSDELRKTGIFKALTGGDKITAEKKNQHPFQFINYAKLVFSCNQLPTSPDNSDAFFRRFILLQFKRVFDDKTADVNIIDKITTEQELSGLFNWALAGYWRLMQQGYFTEGKSTQETREKYLEMSDPINAFILNSVTEDPDEQTIKSEVWKAYGDFCHDKGFISVSETRFFSEFKKRIYVVESQITLNKVRGVRVYKGIKMNKPTQGTQGTQGLYTQKIFEKKEDIEKGVYPVYPVYLEDFKRVLDAVYENKNASTDEIKDGLGWEMDRVSKVLEALQREGRVFCIMGRWRVV